MDDRLDHAAPVRMLDEVTVRVLAPNPSPLTLEGTNTYVIGLPDHGSVIVVDPGPNSLDHKETVETAIGSRDVAAVVVTHHHFDHAEASGWAAEWNAPLRSFDPSLVDGATAFRDGDTIVAAGVTLQSVYTPGHAPDHLCLRVVDTDCVLTGDHILGRGSTLVSWPDGDMAAYMASLNRLRSGPGKKLYPGHGPSVQSPLEKIDEYLNHRRTRKEQIADVVRSGATTAEEVVERVYTDASPLLRSAALLSVKAILKMLVESREVPECWNPSAGTTAPPTVGPLGPTDSVS